MTWALQRPLRGEKGSDLGYSLRGEPASCADGLNRGKEQRNESRRLLMFGA